MRLNKFMVTESINDKGIFKAVFMAGHPGAGKAQPLYSKIRIPNGWTTMGEIKVGDKIVTPKNEIKEVISIHPQGIKDIYRIYMYDGRYVDCTEEHLWKIHGFYKNRKRDWSIRTLSEIKDKINMKTYKDRFFLPLCDKIQYNKKELVIDPYVMGVLLGDGCLKQRISFSNVDIEIIDEVSQNIDDYHISTYNEKDFFICPHKHYKSSYRTYLENVGLWKKYSYEKFIPTEYKYSIIDDRLEIIRGLLDTDGYVSKSGYIQFYTTSEKLKDDFREIIWSLGGNTIVNEKIPHYKNLNGDKINCKKCFCITILYNNSKELFKLQRKKERCKENITHKKRLLNRIKKIEYIGKDEAKCISINDDENLYITDNYIVTHNTYVLRKVKSGSIEPRWVNTDKVFPLFKEWWDKDWPKISEKVKTINKDQLANYINSLLPLAVDGTANSVTNVMKRKYIVESFGYDTMMIFVNTSLETALERASKRPRPVEQEFIRKVYDNISKHKQYYRAKFDDFIEVKNDDYELTDETILKTFKHASSFYMQPIQNPIGKEIKDKMIKNGWKYLNPNITDMKQIKDRLEGWYV